MFDDVQNIVPPSLRPDLLVRSLPTPANTLLRTGLVLEAGAALKLGWTNQR